MHPILFSIGKVNFYTHGLMIALGIISGGLIFYYMLRKENIETKFLLDLIVVSTFFGLIISRIVYVLIYFNQFDSWREMLFFSYGGLVSYGGIVGGLVAAAIMLRKKNQEIFRWFDLAMPGLLFGWTIGRIGCFLSGDSPGISNSSKIAIFGQVPVALIEALWAFLLAGILFYFLQRRVGFIKYINHGVVFLAAMDLYVFGRVFIDYWRDEAAWGSLKSGQIISLILFVIITISFFYLLRKVEPKRRKYA